MRVVDSLRPQLQKLAESGYSVKVALFEHNNYDYWGVDLLDHEPNWSPLRYHNGSYESQPNHFPATLQDFYENRTWANPSTVLCS